MMGGAVVMAIGSFLRWFTFRGEDYGSFTELGDETGSGPAYLTIAVVLLGFGITTLAAKRLLPIAILAVVFASLAALAAVGDLTDIAELIDDLGDGSDGIGPGLPIVLVGSLVALAGGIVALATRRRPVGT